MLGRGQREWIVSIWGQSWSSLIIPAGKVSVGNATAAISAANDYNGIGNDDRAQACLVKNVSPIISIQQPMNNGVGVYQRLCREDGQTKPTKTYSLEPLNRFLEFLDRFENHEHEF